VLVSLETGFVESLSIYLEEDMTQQAYQSSMQNGLLRFEELPNHGKFLRVRERELIERCKQMFTHIAGFLSMANISVIADAQLLQDLLNRDEQGRAPSDPQYLDYKAANETIANLQEQVNLLKNDNLYLTQRKTSLEASVQSYAIEVREKTETIEKLKAAAKVSGQCQRDVAGMKGHWSENFAQLARGIDRLQQTLDDKETTNDTAT